MNRQEQLILTDALTGLKNKRAFNEDIEEDVFRLSKNWVDTVVVLIDLGGYKSLNDTLDHQQRDRLLKIFGTAVQSNFRQEDFIYRIGGDKFALLLLLKLSINLDNIQTTIKKRVDQAIEEISAAGFEQVSASIGISTLSEANFSFQKAVQLANTRLYKEN